MKIQKWFKMVFEFKRCYQHRIMTAQLMLQWEDRHAILCGNTPVSSVIAYVVLEVIIAVFAFLNNMLVLHAVWRFKRLHTTPYKLVASLALADIAVALVANPSGIVLRLGFVISSEDNGVIGSPGMSYPLCLALVSAVLILTQVSIFNLLIIAIDRFLAIEYSLRYKAIVTPTRVRIAVAGTWICGFVFIIGPHLGWESAQKPTNTSQNPILVCTFEEGISMEYMVYVNFLGCVLLPLIVMFVLYYVIFKSARNQLKKIYSDVLIYKKQSRRPSLSSLKSIKDIFVVKKNPEEKPRKIKISLRTKIFLTNSGRKENDRCKHETNRNVIYDDYSKTLNHGDVTSKEHTINDKQGNELSASKGTRRVSLEEVNSIVEVDSTESFGDENTFPESQEKFEKQPRKETTPTKLSCCIYSKSPALSRDNSSPINVQSSHIKDKSPGDNQRRISCISKASSTGSTDTDGNFKMQKILKRRSKYLKKEFNAARSLFIVLGAFVLCWMPLHICNLVTFFVPSVRANISSILDCAILLSHANSLINPIIYAFQLSDMKEAFKKLLKQYWATLVFCLCCCHINMKQVS